MQRTIWIIDDDLVSQFATRYCLQQYKEPFTIATFPNAEEALETASSLISANKALPDIIFLDLVMDDMDGWQFIQQLKKRAKKVSLPEIYVLSAFGKTEDRAIAKAHKNISGFFDKPLTSISLNKVFTENIKS